MADPNANAKGEEAVVPPPTEEERLTETVNDDVEEPREPEPKDEGPDVTARLDVIEREVAALKAMLDTLGFNDDLTDDEGGQPEKSGESIEDLFD